MMREAGFVEVELRGVTGFSTSRFTIGALFYAATPK
jgi:hypothetical protein